jgi:hypothetical protein
MRLSGPRTTPRDEPRLLKAGRREAFVGAGGYQTSGVEGGVAAGKRGRRAVVVMAIPDMAVPAAEMSLRGKRLTLPE